MSLSGKYSIFNVKAL